MRSYHREIARARYDGIIDYSRFSRALFNFRQIEDSALYFYEALYFYSICLKETEYEKRQKPKIGIHSQFLYSRSS